MAASQPDYSNPDSPGSVYPGGLLGYRHFKFGAPVWPNEQQYKNGQAPVASFRISSVSYGSKSTTYSSTEVTGARCQMGWGDGLDQYPSVATAHPVGAPIRGSSGAGFPSLSHRPESWTDCQCGFYVSYDPARNFYNTNPTSMNRTGGGSSGVFRSNWQLTPLFAVVEGSDRVILGQKGFRTTGLRVVGVAPNITAEEYQLRSMCEYPDLKGRDIFWGNILATEYEMTPVVTPHGIFPDNVVSREQFLALIREANPNVRVWDTKEELMAAYPQPSREGLPVKNGIKTYLDDLRDQKAVTERWIESLRFSYEAEKEQGLTSITLPDNEYDLTIPLPDDPILQTSYSDFLYTAVARNSCKSEKDMLEDARQMHNQRMEGYKMDILDAEQALRMLTLAIEEYIESYGDSK